MPSQYTRPGVVISIAQQVSFYRKYVQAQLQQAVSDRNVKKAHSPSSSGLVKPVDQVVTDVKNVALSLFRAAYATSPATVTSYGTIEVQQFCTWFFIKNTGNQSMDQPANQLRPKRSGMRGQLHRPNSILHNRIHLKVIF